MGIIISDEINELSQSRHASNQIRKKIQIPKKRKTMNAAGN